jgi:hypothetical protein
VPGASTCAVTANVPSTLPATGGQFTFNVTTGSTCTWTAKSDALWADITPGSGQGSHALLLNLAQHTRTDDSRTMILTINTQAYRIVQAAATCSYTLSTFGVDVRNEGGRVSVRVSAGDGCAWTAGGSSNSWIGVATTSGTGTDYVYLDVAPNSGGGARQGFVTIAGQRVTVTQAAG